MSFATASCDLWQKEQRSVSSGDLGFKSNSFITRTFFNLASGSSQSTPKTDVSSFVLVDDVVNNAIFFSLLRVHNEIAFHIFFHFLKLLPGMPSIHLISDFPHTEDFSGMYINICGLTTKARHQGLMNKYPRSG